MTPVDDEGLVLVDPWEDLRNPDEDGARQVRRLSEELLSEVSPGHSLHGVAFTLVGRSWARDDVLLRLTGGWAVVHLTYSHKQEPAPWPSTKFYGSVAEVEAALDADL